MTKESLREQLQNKAKSSVEINKQIKCWQKIFREGALGNHDAYNQARDERVELEKSKWVEIKDVLSVLKQHQTELDKLIQDFPIELMDLDLNPNYKRIEEWFKRLCALKGDKKK